MDFDTKILGDPQALANFVQDAKVPPLIDQWAYFAKTNNHAQFTAATGQLRDIITTAHASDPSNELEKHVRDIYTKLLSPAAIKYVYRALHQQKTNITLPMLDILTMVVTSKHLPIFINNFDLGISFLPNMVLKLDNVAKAVIKFWLQLQSHMNYFDRMTYFSHKVWTNLFKLVPVMDEKADDILLAFTTFVSDKVLREVNFKKYTKLKFVNESCLFALLRKLDKEFVRELFGEIIGDKGILFTGLVPGPQGPGPNGPSSGSTGPSGPSVPSVSVNNHSFKLRNKTLYNLLTFIKIDSTTAIAFITSILAKDHSLINPYMHYLLVNGSGYNEPNLTNWYIQHTLLYIEILKLPTSDVNCILLKPLSKAVLVKGLQSSPLIVQLNLSIVYLMVKKVTEISGSNGSSTGTGSNVVNLVLKNLPDVADILAISSLVPSTNMLKLKTLNQYSNHLIVLNHSLINYVNENLSTLTKAPLTSSSLLQLNHLISIQLNLNTKFDLKSNTSILLSLIRFSNHNDNHQLYYELVNKVLVNSAIINTNTTNYDVLNPLWSLVYLPYPEELFDLLLQTINRANNPYKYIDLPYKVHTFIKILVEQYSIYVQKAGEHHLPWFQQLLASFVILGESQDELLALSKHYNIQTELEFDLEVPSFIKTPYEFLCVLKKLGDSPKVSLFELLTNYFDNNPEFVGHLQTPAFFGAFVGPGAGPGATGTRPGSRPSTILPLFKDFLVSINYNPSKEVSQLIVSHLQSQPHLLPLNFLLSNEQLDQHYQNQHILLTNYNQLLSRGQVPSISIDKLLAMDNELALPVIRKKLTPANLLQYLPEIIEKKHFSLLQDVDLSQECIGYLSTRDFDPETARTIGSYISSSNDMSLFFSRVTVPSFSDSGMEFKRYLALVQHWKEYNEDKELVREIVTELFGKGSLTYCKEFVCLVLETDPCEGIGGSSAGPALPGLSAWLTKSMIHITETFAVQTELSTDFYSYVQEYTKLFPLSIPTNVINTQLQVLLSSKWINTKFISYINSLILSEPGLDYAKMVPILLENKNPLDQFPSPANKYIRIEAALMVYNLFTLNPKANVFMVSRLVNWYMGTVRFEDLVIKKILTKIEAITQVSWINKIDHWEVNEFNLTDFELIGYQKLIQNDNMISINRSFITNCVNSSVYFELPEEYVGMVEYINENLVRVSYEYGETIYDPEFLMLLMINNDELFKVDEGSIGVKNIMDHQFLAVLVRNCGTTAGTSDRANGPGASTNTAKFSKIILNYILSKLDSDDSFKDKNLVRIYISSLLNTLTKHPLTNIQLALYASLIPILINPGHALYELVYKYVLSTPFIKPMELPLFHQIKSSNAKTIEWYLLNLSITSSDLRILNVNQFFEWVMNLANLPGKTNPSLIKRVLKVIFAIPDLDNGSISLITKYGVLSFLEQIDREEFRENLGEIWLKLGITQSKRALEWSSYDLHSGGERIKRARA